MRWLTCCISISKTCILMNFSLRSLWPCSFCHWGKLTNPGSPNRPWARVICDLICIYIYVNTLNQGNTITIKILTIHTCIYIHTYTHTHIHTYMYCVYFNCYGVSLFNGYFNLLIYFNLFNVLWCTFKCFHVLLWIAHAEMTLWIITAIIIAAAAGLQIIKS